MVDSSSIDLGGTLKRKAKESLEMFTDASLIGDI
jgi:hypothetical protein